MYFNFQVGLRVHYRHFADDAPEFFAAKINRIETNIIGAEGSGLDDLVRIFMDPVITVL